MSQDSTGGRVRRGSPWLIAKAAQNPEFRSELLANPRIVVERELGVTLPEDFTVHVLEDAPNRKHVVLPVTPNVPPVTHLGGEVSDAQLIEMLRGENDYVCTYSFCPNENDNIESTD